MTLSPMKSFEMGGTSREAEVLKRLVSEPVSLTVDLGMVGGMATDEFSARIAAKRVSGHVTRRTAAIPKVRQ